MEGRVKTDAHPCFLWRQQPVISVLQASLLNGLVSTCFIELVY